MLKIGVESKRGAKDIITKAVDFFGPDGYKLDIREQNEAYVRFSGGGGDVEITATARDGGAYVDIASAEWDFQVKEFITRIQ